MKFLGKQTHERVECQLHFSLKKLTERKIKYQLMEKIQSSSRSYQITAIY